RTLLERDAALAARLLPGRQQHNNCLTIVRLPPEILTIIFMHVSPPEVRCDWADRVWVDESLADIGWIAITHVCRRWRQVAIGYPLLWTNIDFSYGRAWTQAFLSRARSAPLSITSRKP
ncbi:hypothetical protein FA95DRAFT_1451575, partial [Auriscalpium vulgare]